VTATDLTAALRVLRNEIDACNGLNGVYVELHPDVARAILAALDSRPADLLPEGAVEVGTHREFMVASKAKRPRAILEVSSDGHRYDDTRYFFLPAVSE
jgi:hypothetical protein